MHENMSANADENTGRAVRIRWVDSGLSVHDGWMQLADLPRNVETVETIGLWMGENDDVVLIGGTRDLSNDQWLCCQVIWKRAIVSQEWLS